MRATIVMIAVVLTAVFASSALAAGNSSAKAAYGKTGAKVQAAIASKPKHAAVKKVVPAKKSGILGASATASQTLPFTGLDLGFVAGAGIVLVGMGLSLRRVTRKPPTA
jgi:hypothetical protein